LSVPILSQVDWVCQHLYYHK